MVLGSDDPAVTLKALEAHLHGPQWVDAFEKAKDPWFWFSTGAGYTHSDRAWIDDLRPPFTALRGYVQGCSTAMTSAGCWTRSSPSVRVTAEYRTYLPTETDREFDGLVELARQVFPFVENHNFYVEHWHHCCSGRRCASSATSSSPMTSSTTARTSSTCTATRSIRRSTT